ncbi:ABC transporter ATP-binding protein [Algoriphagus namhaensis]
MKLLETKSLSYSHPGQAAISFPDIVLDGQESLLVLGKSGSGKTTLLNLLAGLLSPETGEIFLDGKSITSMNGRELDQFRGRSIGLIFQKPHLLAPLTVEENLKLAPYFGKVSGESPKALLTELGIAQKAHSSVRTLSEGEAQRVSIARALMNRPKLILADEPTSSLDDENAEKVIKLLQEQAVRIQAGLIVVTHDQRVKNHISNFVEVKSA